MATEKSVEPSMVDFVTSELGKYKINYRREGESLNNEIDEALNAYVSKGGGSGGNYPDIKLIIKDVVLWADKKIEATKNVVNR